jgi:hypothetical protein
MPVAVPLLFEFPSNVYQMVGAGLNVAVTDDAAFVVIMQVLAVPVHAPPHPANDEPLAAAAVNVTRVP